MLQFYEKAITEVDVCHYRYKLSYNILKETSDVSYGTPVEKFMKFQLKKMLDFVTFFMIWTQVLLPIEKVKATIIHF